MRNPLIFLVFCASSLLLFVAGARTAAWAELQLALVALIVISWHASRQRPAATSAAHSDTDDPAPAPFSTARAQVAPVISGDMYAAGQLVERALGFYLPAEAREWAEDALRFLRQGQGQSAADSLRVVSELCDGSSTVSATHIWKARQVLQNDLSST
jgi:hypothetical protein